MKKNRVVIQWRVKSQDPSLRPCDLHWSRHSYAGPRQAEAEVARLNHTPQELQRGLFRQLFEFRVRPVKTPAPEKGRAR